MISQPCTIQLETFPDVPEPSTELQAISDYVKTTTARILAAHAGQQKRLAKGKGLLFDPSKDKCLNIYVAKSWPAWQQRYIDLVLEQFDGLTFDAKSLAKKLEKADMKRAMPFIQELKRRLEASGKPDDVLGRVLGFDEVKALNEMAPVLKSTVQRLKGVSIIVVDEPGNTGKAGAGDAEIPQIASSAEPGNPSLEFFNI
jgi:leucyl-tRNA synthetase